jgi:hypothetical protein
MEYKIGELHGEWVVYSGYISYGYFTKEEIVFSGGSLADCYIWLKAKTEGLLLNL